MTYEVKKCRSCGAPVIWTMTAQEKAMPLNADPAPGPLFVLRKDLVGGNFAEAVHAYTSHFSTCPHADEWRRPR